jgi:hypothetical protein
LLVWDITLAFSILMVLFPSAPYPALDLQPAARMQDLLQLVQGLALDTMLAVKSRIALPLETMLATDSMPV